MILYEYPFNERVRTLLRLEDLRKKLEFFLHRVDPYDHQVALDLVFEIADVLSRADLKSEILQEFSRQKQALRMSLANPQLEEKSHSALSARIDTAYQEFIATNGKVGSHLRGIEWLSAIRNRLSIPGGTCQFDIPSYHAWQQKPHAERLRDVSQWIAPFIPFFNAVNLVLEILRNNSRCIEVVATGGNFERLLRDEGSYQLLRLEVADHLAVPEISANKYMLRIRFTRQDSDFKMNAIKEDIPFSLLLCKF